MLLDEIQSYVPGQTIYVSWTVTDAEGEFTEPASITLQVYEPTGTVLFETAEEMSGSGGEYSYALTLADDAATGLYTYEVITTDGLEEGETVTPGYGHFLVRAVPVPTNDGLISIRPTVNDLVRRIRLAMGAGSTDAEALEYLTSAYREIRDGLHPQTGLVHHWSFLEPVTDAVLWTTTTGTIDTAIYDAETGLTTLTATDGAFVSGMIGHPIVIVAASGDPIGTFTIAAWTNSATIVVTGNASAAHEVAATFTITPTGYYSVPSSFGGWRDDPVLAYDSGGGLGGELERVDPRRILRAWADYSAQAQPELIAVTAAEFSETTGDRWFFMVAPIPSEDCTIRFRMVRQVADPIMGGWLPGADILGHALEMGALAAWESIRRENAGFWAAKFQQAMIAAIARDKQLIQVTETVRMR